MVDALPWRAAGPAAAGRPVDLARMPVLLDGRPRKRWRYVGVFGSRVMLCAGVVEIGVVRQAFWAVWDREREALRERTRLWRGGRFVRVSPGAVEIRDGTVQASLRVAPGAPVETASPHGAAWIWTRKQGAVRVRGHVVLAGERVEVEDLGCVDESAGYHARETHWEWSAGVGATDDGRTVGWNVVAGVHDAETASERTIWVDGVPAEAPPATFASGLAGVVFASGERLAFTAEATRARRDDLGVVRSDYVQPFGTFAGALPGGLRLAEGRGVMERHQALW
jgi:Protein of unknown function (DUF2804)